MTQVQTIWVDDPSGFGLQVDDPAQVSDPDDDGELFLGDGSGRANLNPLPVLFPPLREVSDALGVMGISL